MGTGRSSYISVIRSEDDKTRDLLRYGLEYSMLAAEEKGKFKLYWYKSDYDDREDKNTINIDKTTVVNFRNYYRITGDFWALSSEQAVKQMMKGLENVSSIKKRNVINRMLKGLEKGQLSYTDKNFHYKLVPMSTATKENPAYLGEKHGWRVYKYGTRWRIEVTVRKTRRYHQ